MKTLTVDEIMKHRPCRDDYPLERVDALIGAGKTLLEICDLDIPIPDRIWVLTRHDVLPQKILWHVLADCADHVLPIYYAKHDDPAPRVAVETLRRYADGTATSDELKTAAARAARAARAANYAADYAADAACAAARAARAAASASSAFGSDRAFYASEAAADAVSARAERDWQMARFRQAIEENGL